MTEAFAKQIETEARQAMTELVAAAKLKKGDVLVVGCSSSEMVGGHIGKDSSIEAAADKPQNVTQIAFIHANQMIIPCIIQPGHLPGGLAVAVDAMFCQLLPRRRIDRISDFPCTGGG